MYKEIRTNQDLFEKNNLICPSFRNIIHLQTSMWGIFIAYYAVRKLWEQFFFMIYSKKKYYKISVAKKVWLANKEQPKHVSRILLYSHK